MGDTLEPVETEAAPHGDPTAGGLGQPPQHRSSLLHDPTIVLILLLAAALLFRVIWLSSPYNRLIFDETYYINAARTILGWQVPMGQPYALHPGGRDPNTEHPPLGKLMMAASIGIVGDNTLGWRLPSLIAGMASIVLLYGIVRRAGGDAWLGVLAAALFAFDNLAFVHSRLGTLDMLLVALMLLGAWLFLQEEPLAAGIACGFAALVKLGGVYSLAGLLLFEAGRAGWDWKRTRALPRARLRSTALLVAGFFPTWLGGLWLLDLWVGAFRTPWGHLRHMLDIGFALSRPGAPADTESYPWQWLINETQVPYLRVTEDIGQTGPMTASRTHIFFRGAMNPVIIGAASLGLAYAAWRAWRLQDQLALWAIAWTAGTYLPFYPLAIVADRISYLYYFLPTLPSVTIGLALLLRRAGLPHIVLWGYLLAVLIGFIGYFPFRTLSGLP